MALVRVVDIEGRGRALIASRPIRAGEVILSDSPLLLYPPDCTSSSSFCCVCFRTTLPTLSDGCSSCSGVALFCSPRCLAQASHSPWTCQTLSRLRSHNPPLHPDLITQAHFLVAAYALPAPDFQRLLSLHGAHPKPPDQQEEEVVLLLLLHSLISSPPPPIPGFSPELTAALLAKDKMNSFGLMEPFPHQDRKVRAYGIYPNASFFNHDCLPNACRFDYVDSPGDTNTQIVVRAIHHIPQGREVCLSYFPVNWSYKDRQLRLLEDYGFHCICDRCEVEKNWKDDDDDDEVVESMEQEEEEGEDEEMENDSSGAGPDGDFPHAYFFMSYLCQRENCGGTLAPLPPSPQATPTGILECNVCGLLRKDEDVDEEDVEDTDSTMRDQ